MNKTKHYLTLLIIIMASLVCYSLAMSQGATLFLIAGLILETTFWVKLIKRKRER